MSASRLQKLRAAMAERNLDGILITKPENRAYLSGFNGSAGTLLVTSEKAFLATDFRYTEQATAQAPDFTVVRPENTAQAWVARTADELQVKRIGFEGDYMTVDEYQTTREFHSGRELVSCTGLVEELRMIKDESEIALIRKACAISDEAFQALLPTIRPGVSERDLALELEYQMKKRGAEGLAFETIAASGDRSSLPHGHASAKLVEHGDFITFDFGALYEGYCADITRTVVVGAASEKQQEIYAIVLEAQLRGVAACKAGMTGAELDDVCRSYIREKGYGENFGHG
ncbi:MAG: M24 family metallopeptidase, partial [Mycobacterium leprae]